MSFQEYCKFIIQRIFTRKKKESDKIERTWNDTLFGMIPFVFQLTIKQIKK